MKESLPYCSPEQLIIDKDIIGGVQRTIRGIDVTDGALPVDNIQNTCLNCPLHFVGSQPKLDRMQSEYAYPISGDRTTLKEWTERGKPSMVARAAAKVHDVPAKNHSQLGSVDLDSESRRKFHIHLSV